MKTVGWLLLIILSFSVCCETPMTTPPGIWSPLGPELSAPWCSGRASIIEVNPFNERDVWLGTATGGVWHSFDALSSSPSWEPLTEAAQSQSIGSIALRACGPSRCDSVWVGTGENNIRRDTYYGSGIYLLVWSAATTSYQLSVVGNTASYFRGGAVYKLLFKGNTLFAAIGLGKTSSSSGTIVKSPPPPSGFGLFKSSDKGITWHQVGSMPDISTFPTDMEISNGNLFVGLINKGIYWLNEDANQLCPLHASIAGCAATSSGGLPDPLMLKFDFIEIEVSKSNPNILYAAFGQCDSETWTCADTPLFYKSINGGFTWTQKNALTLIRDPTRDFPMANYSRYTHAMEIHPTRPELFYYGGVGLWISSDSGDNLYFIGSDPSFSSMNVGSRTHLDMQSVKYVNPTSSLMYLATDGGLFYSNSSDRLNWTPLNDGLSTTQFYTISVNKLGNNMLVGGTQDNGTLLFNGAHLWPQILSGDGGDCYVRNNETIFASTQLLSPAVSYDGGSSFTYLGSGLVPGEQSLVSPMFTLHPVFEDLYITGERLYKYSNIENRWQSVSPVFDESPEIIKSIEKKNVISALGLSNSDRNLILIGMHDGTIWKTNSCGPCVLKACWTRIVNPMVSGTLQPVGPVTSIEIHPSDPNVILTTHSSFSSEGTLFKSTDGGQTWSRFDQGLQDSPSKIIKIDPTDLDVLWLGRDDGIFYRNSASDWLKYTISEGIPEMPVYDIDFNADGEVYAATHGRGIYKLGAPELWEFVNWENGIFTNLSVYGYAFKARNRDCTYKLIDSEGNSIEGKAPSLKTNRNGELLSYYDSIAWKYGLHLERSAIVSDLKNIRIIEVTCGGERQQKVLPQAPEKYFTSVSLKLEPKMEMLVKGDVNFRIPGSSGCSFGIRYNSRDSIANFYGGFKNNISDHCKSYRLVDSKFKKVDEESDPNWVQLLGPEREKQLVPEIEAAPSVAHGFIYYIRNIGDPVNRDMTTVGVEFYTTDNGAQGGEIEITEHSGLGICRKIISVKKGATKKDILQNVYDSFRGVENPSCSFNQNPEDFVLKDGHGVFTMATGLTIDIRDKNIGIRIFN